VLDSFKLTKGQKYDIDIYFVERRLGGGIYIGGISNFETRTAVRIDTLWDTSFVCKTHDTLCDSGSVGIRNRGGRNLLNSKTFGGLHVPNLTHNVSVAYFSAAGAKVFEREIPLSLAAKNQPLNLPKGMYVVRVAFLDANRKVIARGAFRQMILNK
jgi:hypothetical protein